MIDTLNLFLDFLDEATRNRAFTEIPKCFDNEPSEHFYPDSNLLVLDGYLGSLKVSVSPIGVKVGNSSFAKWILGSNLKTLTRKDIQSGIEKLSDLLHLPMGEARVTRLDFGCNLIMNQPIGTYMPYLGNIQRFSRLEQPNGLYYKGANSQAIFYDKIKEIKHDGFKPPELYRDKNVLRYEVRIKQRLKEVLKVPEITAKLLFDEQFYIGLWLFWRNFYYKIPKNVDIVLGKMGVVRNIKELKEALLLRVIKEDGLNNIFDWIKGMQDRGEIDKHQADRLREPFERACKISQDGAAKSSDYIKELDRKIDEATRYFR